jgi:hypothetical protein
MLGRKQRGWLNKELVRSTVQRDVGLRCALAECPKLASVSGTECIGRPAQLKSAGPTDAAK